MKLLFKYNTESRGREGNNNTWTIFKNPDKGLQDFVYTDHIEFEVDITTIEKTNGFGFGMVCNGEIEHKMSPIDGSMYVYVKRED